MKQSCFAGSPRLSSHPQWIQTQTAWWKREKILKSPNETFGNAGKWRRAPALHLLPTLKSLNLKDYGYES